MVGTPSLKKIRKAILKILENSKEELTGYEIATIIYPDLKGYPLLSKTGHIYQNLNYLFNEGLILKHDSKPAYYKINPKKKGEFLTEVVLYEIKCPHCGRLWWIGHQDTKQCTCQTKGGKQRRFYLANRKTFTGGKKNHWRPKLSSKQSEL